MRPAPAPAPPPAQDTSSGVAGVPSADSLAALILHHSSDIFRDVPLPQNLSVPLTWPSRTPRSFVSSPPSPAPNTHALGSCQTELCKFPGQPLSLSFWPYRFFCLECLPALPPAPSLPTSAFPQNSAHSPLLQEAFPDQLALEEQALSFLRPQYLPFGWKLFSISFLSGRGLSRLSGVSAGAPRRPADPDSALPAGG